MALGRSNRRRTTRRLGGFSNLHSGGELLEARWTPAWTGVPPTTISVPASPTQVTLTNNDASGTATISSTEIDYYSFVAGATGSYVITALTPSSNLDPVIGVFSSTGSRLGYNDDISTTNQDSRLTINLTAGQRYYLGVTNYTGSVGGAYTWGIDGPASTTPTDDSYENNDTFAAASNLGTLSNPTTISNLKMADAHDYYKFTMSGTGTSADYVQISFTHAQGDLDLEILNSAGTRVGISQSVSGTERVNLTNRAAGTYYVHVYGYRGAFNPNYSLTIDPASGSAPTPTRDLTGASLSVTSAGSWGQTITVSAAARNLGNTASGAFTAQFYLSRDANGSSDDILLNVNGATNGNVAFASINGGATGAAVNATLRMPSALPSGWSGTTFYVVMKLDTGNVVAETNESNNFSQAASFSITSTPPTGGGFQITLNITGMTSAQQTIFQQAAARWQQIITGDLPNATYNGVTVDDILIEASGRAIDGTGGILGQAGPDRFRSGSYLPYHGVMQFDTADLASMQSNGSLFSVIFHEMGHVLGIGTIWSQKGLLSGAGTSNPRFTGAQATAAYNQIFGRNESGVPVENTGGSGTRDAHWREATFNNEIMTGWINSGSNPISRVTIASMADLGYTVNMNAADAYTPPGGSALMSGGGSSSSSGARLQSASVDLWMAQLGNGQQHVEEEGPILPLGWE